MTRRPKSTDVATFVRSKRPPSPGSRGARRLARETDPADPGLTIACWHCSAGIDTPCLHLAGRRALTARNAELRAAGPRAGLVDPATLTDATGLDAAKALDAEDARRVTDLAVANVAAVYGSDNVQRTHVPPDYVEDGAWVCLLVFVPLTETPTR